MSNTSCQATNASSSTGENPFVSTPSNRVQKLKNTRSRGQRAAVQFRRHLGVTWGAVTRDSSVRFGVGFALRSIRLPLLGVVRTARRVVRAGRHADIDLDVALLLVDLGLAGLLGGQFRIAQVVAGGLRAGHRTGRHALGRVLSGAGGAILCVRLRRAT